MILVYYCASCNFTEYWLINVMSNTVKVKSRRRWTRDSASHQGFDSERRESDEMIIRHLWQRTGQHVEELLRRGRLTKDIEMQYTTAMDA